MYLKDKVVQECVEVAEVQDIDDNNRVSADKGRQYPKWKRLFRNSSRRWRMFRLSNKAIAIHGDTAGRANVIGDNLLRCHLFGVVG